MVIGVPGKVKEASEEKRFDAKAIVSQLLHDPDNAKYPGDALLVPENMAALMDEALASLKRSNAIATSEIEAWRKYQAESAVEMAKLQASQRETKAMIEDLVNGR